jgi:hypothetical protein
MNFLIQVKYIKYNNKLYFSFLEIETIKIPNRNFKVQQYSQESIFKPGKKLVKLIRENKTIHKFSDELIPAIKEIKPFIKKKYYFEQINDYHNEKEEEYNKKLKETAIINNKSDYFNNSFDITFKKDFTKHFYENISNNKLLGVTFTKESFNALKKKTLPKINKDDYLKNSNSIFRHFEGKKMASLKSKQENRERDINYVISLNNWGRKTESLGFKSISLIKKDKE